MTRRVEPRRSHGVVRRARVIVSYERAALRRPQALAFAALAARGLRAFERLARLPARFRICFELRSRTRISTARGRTILLSPYRVAARSAPYLHEIAHALFPCAHSPAWFSEGLACYLESLLSERGAGYDSRLFTSGGNRAVDADAARWLADPRGCGVLRFIGVRGMPRDIVADRHNVAAPFYVLSHSLVKFLARRAGLPALLRLARARRFSPALRRLTGQSTARWRAAWLDHFVPPCPNFGTSRRLPNFVPPASSRRLSD